MEKRVNTIARFTIALYFTVWGLTETIIYQSEISAIQNLPEQVYAWTMLVLMAVTFTAGLFLFIRKKVKTVSIVLVGATYLSLFFFENQALEILKSVALIGGLLLLIRSGGGETLMEYIQTDLEHLPDYKTRL